MSKTLMIAVVMSLGLAGCAEMPRVRIAPDPATPQVTVIEGKFIVVDQEPIVVPKGQREFQIRWRLPVDSSYRFPRDGIVVSEPKDQFKCAVEGDGAVYGCIFRNTVAGRYKYTIKVTDGGRLLEPLDPTIVSNF